MAPTRLPFILALLAFCTVLSCALGGRDLYEILGVPRDASKRAIKKEYHRLARRYHPDKNPGDAKMEKRFKDISRAYEVLSDDDQRARYDAYGEEGLNNGGEGGGGGSHGGFHFGGGNMGGFQMHFDEATFQDMFNMGMGMGGARAGSHDSGSFFGGWGGGFGGAGRQREQRKMKVCNDDKICENSKCYTRRTCKTS